MTRAFSSLPPSDRRTRSPSLSTTCAPVAPRPDPSFIRFLRRSVSRLTTRLDSAFYTERRPSRCSNGSNKMRSYRRLIAPLASHLRPTASALRKLRWQRRQQFSGVMMTGVLRCMCCRSRVAVVWPLTRRDIGTDSMQIGARRPWHLPKLCFSAKVLLPVHPILPQNHSSQPMKIHLFKPRRLLFPPLPLPLPTNPPLPSLLPQPIGRRVCLCLLLLQEAHPSGSHLACGTVVTLTTTGIMASTLQGMPSFQEPCRGP